MNLNGKGPGPKVFYFLVATVFVVVFTISHNNYRKNNPKTTRANTTQSEEFSISITNPTRNISSDLDSSVLVDWEETLKKSLEQETIMGEDIFLSADDGTFTANVSERAIMNLLQGLENPNSSLDLESFAQQVVGEVEANITYQNEFSKNDLTIVPETDESIVEYMNNFWLISVEEFSWVPEFDHNDFESMMNFMPEIYDKIVIRLSTVNVPENLSDIHLNYINSTAEMSHHAKILSQERSDPLLAYASIPKFQEAAARTDYLFTQIVTYPENNDIIFEEGDYAYFFYND